MFDLLIAKLSMDNLLRDVFLDQVKCIPDNIPNSVLSLIKSGVYDNDSHLSDYFSCLFSLIKNVQSFNDPNWIEMALSDFKCSTGRRREIWFNIFVHFDEATPFIHDSFTNEDLVLCTKSTLRSVMRGFQVSNDPTLLLLTIHDLIQTSIKSDVLPLMLYVLEEARIQTETGADIYKIVQNAHPSLPLPQTQQIAH